LYSNNDFFFAQKIISASGLYRIR